MENATKALMIAGAVLMAIVIIGLGMAIFNGVGGILNSGAEQGDELEIKQFNSKFEKYEGNRSGSQCRDLISTVRTNNNTQSRNNNSAKVVEVTVNFDGAGNSNVSESNKTEDADLQEISSKIIPGNRYNVKTIIDTKTSYIHEITIEDVE